VKSGRHSLAALQRRRVRMLTKLGYSLPVARASTRRAAGAGKEMAGWEAGKLARAMWLAVRA
jgi:hypothetical protein